MAPSPRNPQIDAAKRARNAENQQRRHHEDEEHVLQHMRVKR